MSTDRNLSHSGRSAKTDTFKSIEGREDPFLSDFFESLDLSSEMSEENEGGAADFNPQVFKKAKWRGAEEEAREKERRGSWVEPGMDEEEELPVVALLPEHLIRFYACDEVDDTDWGCVYRSFQNVFLSFMAKHPTHQLARTGVPSMRELMRHFKAEEQPKNVRNNWIEPAMLKSYLVEKVGWSPSTIRCVLFYQVSPPPFSRMLKTTPPDYDPPIITNPSELVKLLKRHLELEETYVLIDDGLESFAIYGFSAEGVLMIDPHKEDAEEAVDKVVLWRHFLASPLYMLFMITINEPAIPTAAPQDSFKNSFFPDFNFSKKVSFAQNEEKIKSKKEKKEKKERKRRNRDLEESEEEEGRRGGPAGGESQGSGGSKDGGGRGEKNINAKDRVKRVEVDVKEDPQSDKSESALSGLLHSQDAGTWLTPNAMKISKDDLKRLDSHEADTSGSCAACRSCCIS